MPGKRGVYPGTFDPVTNGHMDIITRSARLVDRLVIAVAVNIGKGPLFSLDERVEMVEVEIAGEELVLERADRQRSIRNTKRYALGTSPAAAALVGRLRAQGAGGRGQRRRSVDPDRAEPHHGARAPEGLGVGVGPRRPAAGAPSVARG